MRAVMGIDAAWTTTQPTGVALAVEDGPGWRLVAAESSYQRFLARADSTLVPEIRPSGSIPYASDLLRAASALGGAPLDLVAVDMPLAQLPIVGRRACDNDVSRAYGSRKCGTHSPTVTRPGRVAEQLRETFAAAGYPLRTDTAQPPGVVEVYPHPALVELAGAAERLPYKAAKTRRYWPSLDLVARRVRLLAEWSGIVSLLETEISGVTAALPVPDPSHRGATLKSFEDTLDAVVCAWVAICALEGRATPFGDDHSTIWVPASRACARPTLSSFPRRREPPWMPAFAGMTAEVRPGRLKQAGDGNGHSAVITSGRTTRAG